MRRRRAAFETGGVSPLVATPRTLATRLERVPFRPATAIEVLRSAHGKAEPAAASHRLPSAYRAPDLRAICRKLALPFGLEAFGVEAHDHEALEKLDWQRVTHGSSTHAFLTVRCSMRFSGVALWTMRWTKMPGVWIWSGSSSPTSTRCSTSAMVIFPAVATIGLKFRAVIR